MGKISSKHAAICKRTAPEGECFLVDAKVASVKDLMDAINCHGGSLSEAFVEQSGNRKMQNEISHLESPTKDFIGEKADGNGLLFDARLFNIPLTVTLPPMTKETDLLKLLTVDGPLLRSHHPDHPHHLHRHHGLTKGEEDSPSIDGIQTDTTDNNHGSSSSHKADQQSSQENESGTKTTVEANGGSELQEWHFTLYDFDDLGKITKEDIAGLLKSLYDTVGSVITLQQQGTRVLKLHLTVSPDQGVNRPLATQGGTKDNSCNAATAGQEHQCTKGGAKSDNSPPSAFRSVPVGAAQSPAKKPSRLTTTKCPLVHQGSPRTAHHKTKHPPDRQRRRPPVLLSRDKRQDVVVTGTAGSDGKDINDLLLTRQMSFCSGEEGDIIDAAAAAAAAASSTPGANVRRRRQQQHQQQQRHQCSSGGGGGTSKRLSEFDERQLAHLIQQNMSLNDQHLQHSKRTGRRHSIFVNKSQANTDHPHPSPPPSPSPPFAANRTCTNGADDEESAQRRNYYLDLAGIENFTCSASVAATHDLASSAQPSCGIISRAEKGTKSQNPAKSKTTSSSAVKHFEQDCSNSSRGTNAHGGGTDRIIIREENEETLSPLNRNFPAATANVVSQSNAAAAAAANDLETISSSHYRRRHRHREKNQSRAMKQVAEWIEKEHIYETKTKTKTEDEKRVVVSVQRHEHHHVHEHFHHHFHHCNHT